MILSAIASAAAYLRFEDLHLDPVLWHFRWDGRDLFDLKWYSIAYIAGIVIGWLYLMRLLRAPGAPMAKRHAEDLVLYATLGIILGGRLGYVIFYAPEMFVNPVRIVRLWDGGMSLHGGVLGTSLAIWLFSRKHKLNWLRVHDYVACCTPFGLLFGRLANFVNGELWGKPADVPWAIIFPRPLPAVPRHPSQLYEAALEGIVLFAILWFFFWRTKARYDPGKLTGIFLLGYGGFRFFVEFFREPDEQFRGTIFDNGFIHMGQWLCVPMLLGGLYLVWTAHGRRRRIEPTLGTESVA